MTEHPPDLTRSQKAAFWIVDRMPKVLIQDTERVVLNVATGSIGVTSLLALREPGTIAEVLSIPLLVLWSVTLILGSIFVLIGMTKSFRVVERAGLMLTSIGCATYASALFSVGGVRAQIIGIVFIGIALAKVIRLIVSSVADLIANGRRL
jgi:hypothetical protein